MLHFRIATAACLTALTFSATSVAGEITYNAGAGLEYVRQSVDDIDANNTINSDNIIITPFISAAFDSKDVDLFVQASHNFVRRSLEGQTATNNYTDFSYLGRYQIIDNLLNVQVNGAQNYRSQAANSFLVDSFLLNAENLQKTTSNSASLNFNLPTGDYFGANARLTLSNSRIDSDSENINTAAFNNDSVNGRGQIVTGRDFRPFFVDLIATANLVDRQANQDLESQTIDLTLGFDVVADFSLRALGYYEDNSFSSNEVDVDAEEAATREFYRYGLGLAWQPANNRFIELAANQSISKSSTDSEDDDEETFLSLDMQWAFSSRTNVRASYTRRFFGESGSFRFSHNLRNIRSRITYTENLTTNSQLVFDQQDGLLVCANGSSDLSDCSLTDDLNPDLGPGDVAIPISIDAFDLNDRVILRKALTAQTAVDMRRTTITGILSRSTNEEQEIEGDLLTLTARLLASLRVSSRSTLSASVTYSDVERNTAGTFEDSTVKQASFEYERRLTRRLFASVGFNYLNRAGGNIGGGGGGQFQGINGPLKDRNISAEIRYEYNR